MSEKKILEYKISFSEFSTYLQCPHKWYLSYCLKMPTDYSEELIFGSAVHHTIEDILSKSYFQRQTSWEPLFKGHLKKELEGIKDEQFLKKFSDQGLPLIYVRKGVELIKRLDFFNRFKEYRIVDIEHRLDNFPILEVDDINFFFKGYIDLVLQHKKTDDYVIIDWKTSGKEWDIMKKMKDDENLYAQLGLYKLFFAKKNHIPLSKIEGFYYNLPRSNPKAQQKYTGILNLSYLKFLFQKFQDICEEISEIDPYNLNKIKFISKKNYCHRCNFNTEKLCNDSDEHQLIM